MVDDYEAAADELMEGSRLSIIDHLEEMRMRMLKSIACIAVLFPICYLFSLEIIDFLRDRVFSDIPSLYATEIQSVFFIRLKVSIVMAIIAGFPYLAYHLWRFVAPGLFPHERKYVSHFVFVSTLLFCLGASFALFFIYPTMVRFFVRMADKGGVEVLPTLANFVNLASLLMLAFGIMFQLPIIVYLLAVTGLIEIDTMKRCRPIVVAVIFVASAVLTPPDVISQIALGVPSILLFEMSLIFASFTLKRRARKRREEDAAEAAAADRDAGDDEDEAGPDEDGDDGGPDDDSGDVAATPDTGDATQHDGNWDDNYGYYDDYEEDYWAEYDGYPGSGRHGRKEKKGPKKKGIRPLGRPGRKGLRRLGSGRWPPRTPPRGSSRGRKT